MNETRLINILGDFCGKRDLPDLTQESLQNRYGIRKADVFVLFGGSILAGGDLLAEAMKSRIAKHYIIVGGAGHTTGTLRNIARQNLNGMDTEHLTEAEIFNLYIKEKYGLEADYLECKSTNCGNNITLLLELMETQSIEWNSIILSQDAAMQYRMTATLKKYTPDKLIINYAAYQVDVTETNHKLSYREEPLGMWEIDRYLTLLMGEIPRLRDDENGYGPKGRNFISHVDIPYEVEAAFAELKARFAGHVREANPLYASAAQENSVALPGSPILYEKTSSD